jgi:hypothetical protein
MASKAAASADADEDEDEKAAPATAQEGASLEERKSSRRE